MDIRYIEPTIEILANLLCAKSFTPGEVGDLGALLGFRNCELRSADIGAICSTLKFIYKRERAAREKTLKRSRPHRLNKEIQSFGKFCVLCDKLTELHSELRVRSYRDIQLEIDALRMRSSTYCEEHAPEGARHEDAAAKAEAKYGHLVIMILQETRHDDEFRTRFVATDSTAYDGPTEATNFRLPHQSRCRSAAEFAYIANVRHIARLLANQDVAGATARAIDNLVQRGVAKWEILQKLGISKTLFTRNCDLAIARLKYQGWTAGAICRALGISPQSLSQKKPATGCFDFSEGRNPLLVWWPYNDLRVRNIVCLRARAAKAWQHMASEYEGKTREGRSIFRHSLSVPHPNACLIELF